MKVSNVSLIVNLPSDFRPVDAMMDPESYWTVPVDASWSVTGENKPIYNSASLKINVFASRDTSLNNVQEKALELAKAIFDPAAINFTHIK
ncbi:hypothetical protein [Limnobaculum xujianqingii]|uniref:hypothetical protein n=1 Tax=Limnobaculum xujianqingii TaxID=2738837 RepID=UPI00112A8A10|nr:hypothetical protein [Limnobaculum xujianqingii]